MKKINIGLLGGTFDPIHYGHIRPALAVKRQLNLDQIWLMPNAIPPHKSNKITAQSQRKEMVELVCQANADFSLCDIEINSAKLSYTVDTLKLLNKIHPDYQFTFIMGTDSLVNLTKWYQWQRLFQLCHIAVCTRPDWQLNVNLLAKEITQRLSTDTKNITLGKISLVDVAPQAFSSTNIRAIIKKIPAQNHIFQAEQRNFLKQALPKEVLNYICQHQLYQ